MSAARGTTGPRGTASRRRGRNALLLAGAAVAALAIGAVLVPRLRRAPEGGTFARPRRAIAVIGFRNASGRPETSWISTAVGEMLTTELAAGGRLRAIAGEDVARTRLELGLGDTDTFAKKTLARLRKSLGADLVVLGSYTDLGESSGRQIRLDVRLQDTALGETVASVAVSGTEDRLFELVSAAGAELRAKAGLGAVSPAESGRVKKTIPDNPEAAALYAKGLSKLRLLETLEAKDLLVKAAALEPSHPLVHSALSSAWGALGYDAKAAEEARRALELSQALPEGERLAVEERAAEAARDFPKAIDAARRLLAAEPDDPEAAYRLASVQLAGGRATEALATLQELRRRLPDGSENVRLELLDARAYELLSDHRGHLTAANRAAHVAEGLGARLLLAKARASQGKALVALGDSKKALAPLEEARTLFAASGDLSSSAWALHALASIVHEAGDSAGARARDEEALAIFRRIGDRAGVGVALDALALIRLEAGDAPGARALYEESLEIMREVGSTLGEARVLNNLSNLQLLQGDMKGARQSLEASLALYRKAPNRSGIGGALNNLAEIVGRTSELGRAQAMYEEALVIAKELGEKSSIGLTQANLGTLLAKMGKVAEARRLAESARDLAREVGGKAYLGDALALLADVETLRGELAAARTAAEEARRLRREVGEKDVLAESDLQIARLSLLSGGAEEAEGLARSAAAELHAQKEEDRSAAALAVLSRALLARNRAGDARREAERASALLNPDMDFVVRLRVRLAVEEARAASGAKGEALGPLAKIAEEARSAGLLPLALETRLARARLEPPEESARTRAVVRTEAEANGLGLFARLATDGTAR